jgi:ABC-type enterobactin transport system permease subunit
MEPLSLGDDLSAGLRLGVDSTRILFLLASTVLAGAATATAGAISFLAMAAPELAQRTARTSHPPLFTGGAVGAAVLLHDLTLAARFADHLDVVDQGRVAAEGPPTEVLTAALLSNVFGLRATVLSVDGAPAVVPARLG